MRTKETCSLRWEALESGSPSVLTLPRSDAKTRKPRKVPIVGPLKKILERRMARRVEGCPLIFHRDGRSLHADHGGLRVWCYSLWRRACAEVGLPDLLPYDLRRSAIRNLIAVGVPQVVAMAISGHRTTSTFRRYAIVDTSDIEGAFRRVDKYGQQQANREKRRTNTDKGRRNLRIL